MPRSGQRPRGFTLIELLIVVAIIAILAAIAVPNFLEAQTRAKASRATADLRSIAVALESYRVDSNAYPTMLEPGFNHLFNINPFKWWYVPDALSTPIAYLTSAALECPFGGDSLFNGGNPEAAFPGGIWRRYSYENIAELEQGARDGVPLLGGKYAENERASQRIGLWRVLCIGPDMAWNPMLPYDPSNGTVSAGNVMRTQADPQGRDSHQLD